MSTKKTLLGLLTLLVLIMGCVAPRNPLEGVVIPEPTNPDPFFFFIRGIKATYYRQSDQYAQGKEDLEFVIKNDPGMLYPEAYPFLVECYRLQELGDSTDWIYAEAQRKLDGDPLLATAWADTFKLWQSSYPEMHEIFKAKTWKLLDQNVEPVGGYKYLYQVLEYPEMARDMNRSGVSYFSFMVGVNGSISEFNLLKSSYPDLDEAAEIAINKVTWKPANYRGRILPYQMILPVHFRL